MQSVDQSSTSSKTMDTNEHNYTTTFTCHTDCEVVSELFPNMFHNIRPIREPVLTSLPLIITRGICTSTTPYLATVNKLLYNNAIGFKTLPQYYM